MGIDKIGKNTGLPEIAGPEGAASPTGTTGAAGVGRSFAEVHAEKTSRPESAAVEAPLVAGGSPLEQLRAGSLDLQGYLDARVSQATAGLRGLSETQLDTIRVVLREQLLTDPTLAELVSKATGQVPTAPED